MVCTSCGKEQEGDTPYCTNCGARLGQDPAVQPGVVQAAGVKYAGFWRRVAAAIIDIIMWYVAGQLIAVITIFGTDNKAIIIAIYYTGSVIIGWLYFAIMESTSNQATLGKMALSIFVTDSAGNRISFARATGRHFAKFISTIIIFVGIIMIAFTDKKQGLHDRIAGTMVIKKEK